MINYKKTLNLPKTKFPMKGNLVKNEPLILKKWFKNKLYEKIRKNNKGKKKFILHDGPPYANGPIHIGHAVNKILKDIIIKYKGLENFNAPFLPGWDCHGLPIELNVEKKIKKKIKDYEFINKCRKYPIKQINKQKKDFCRLGVIADWKKSYLTMDFKIEANIIRTLNKIIKKGILYKGKKPVYWCFKCKSSLSESEIEYFKINIKSIYVSFKVINSKNLISILKIKNFNEKIEIIIWTTTPWTLPANCAVSINPNMDYQLIRLNNRYFIIIKNLVKKFLFKKKKTNYKLINIFKGKKLKNIFLKHPFMKFIIPIILDKNIECNIGTGIVHIAPNYGLNDYLLGKKHKLKFKKIINKYGYFLPIINKSLTNKHIFNSNKELFFLLKKNNSLILTELYKHKYPHCWRHKVFVIFRSTTQFFLSMKKKKLRYRILKIIKKVKWIPKYSKSYIKNLIKKRPDWCISRQRLWGVPLCLIINKKTKKLHPKNEKIMKIIAKKVEKKGIQAWWNLKLKKIIGKKYKNYYKSKDILDVWFDSGSTHLSVNSIKKEYFNNIIDIYLEGSDQHRGWFMSSLIISVAIYNKAPYKKVLTHGFVVDSEGKKMSKSLGNTLSPQYVIKKYGADILRIWVASTNYKKEMTISNKILNNSCDIYRKIRNTARFLLANLNKFNPLLDKISKNKMIIFDKWAVSKALEIQNKIIFSYKKYKFNKVIKYIIKFCSKYMGSFYFEIIKDRQYTSKYNTIPHRSCQTAMYHILEALVRWISPVISFTSDEIWNYIPGKRKKFVFTETWYSKLFNLKNNEIFNNKFWKIILNIRNKINKKIEKLRSKKIIFNSLESKITLYVKKKLFIKLSKLKKEICFVFSTSKLILKKKKLKIKNFKIFIEKIKGKKCNRCWHYTKDIGKNKKYLDICERCINNINNSGENRKFI